MQTATNIWQGFWYFLTLSKTKSQIFCFSYNLKGTCNKIWGYSHCKASRFNNQSKFKTPDLYICFWSVPLKMLKPPDEHDRQTTSIFKRRGQQWLHQYFLQTDFDQWSLEEMVSIAGLIRLYSCCKLLFFDIFLVWIIKNVHEL